MNHLFCIQGVRFSDTARLKSVSQIEKQASLPGFLGQRLQRAVGVILRAITSRLIGSTFPSSSAAFVFPPFLMFFLVGFFSNFIQLNLKQPVFAVISLPLLVFVSSFFNFCIFQTSIFFQIRFCFMVRCLRKSLFIALSQYSICVLAMYTTNN